MPSTNCQDGCGERLDRVRNAIASLAGKGQLRPSLKPRGSCSRLDQQVQSISTIAIPTADRADQITRMLTEVKSLLDDTGRHVRVLVCDDSRSRSRGPISCEQQSYIGVGERKKLVHALAAAGANREAAEFAILGAWRDQLCTTGAARNTILLLTTGENILCLDDDLRCTFVDGRQDCGMQVRLTGHSAPRRYTFYSDPDTLINSQRWSEIDLLGMHERVLGRTVPDVLEMAGGAAIVDDLCDSLRPAISRRQPGRIAVSIGGIVGDSGLYASFPLLFDSGPTRDRMISDERVLRIALRSRQVLSVAKEFTITHDPLCMAGAAGFANAELLPPFFPVGRNEDGVFGMLIHRLAPELVMSHIPIAIRHSPADQTVRSYETQAPFRIAELMIALFSVCDPLPDVDGESKLKIFGEYLRSIADSSVGTQHSLLRNAVEAFEETRFERCQQALTQIASGSLRAQNCVKRVCRHLEKRHCDPWLWIPSEFRGVMPLASASQRTRALIRKSGLLLSEWPMLRLISKSVKAQVCTPGVVSS